MKNESFSYLLPKSGSRSFETAFFLPAAQRHERSERPTLKWRHDGDGIGSGGGAVYCEAGARAEA